MLSDHPRKVDMRFTSSVKIEALSNISLARLRMETKLKETVMHCSRLKTLSAVHDGDMISVTKEGFPTLLSWKTRGAQCSLLVLFAVAVL